MNVSLVIHPDKATHARAPEAFDLLKKVSLYAHRSKECLTLSPPLQAAAELSEKEKRLDIDSTIMFARTELLKAAGISLNTPDDDPHISRMQPSYKEQLQKKVKDLLIDEEVRRRRFVHSTMNPIVF